MDKDVPERELRQEAIHRRLQGERPCEICCDLCRSKFWFNKWWNEYKRNPETDFSDRSRAPHISPHQTPLHVEEAVEGIRKALEAAKSLNAEVEGKKLLGIYATLCGQEKERKSLPFIGGMG